MSTRTLRKHSPAAPSPSSERRRALFSPGHRRLGLQPSGVFGKSSESSSDGSKISTIYPGGSPGQCRSQARVSRKCWRQEGHPAIKYRPIREWNKAAAEGAGRASAARAQLSKGLLEPAGLAYVPRGHPQTPPGPVALREEELLKVALRLYRRVEEVHGKGVVHNDLKDNNIMAGANLEVHIIDFGLASLEHAAAERDVPGGCADWPAPEVRRRGGRSTFAPRPRPQPDP
ncbi:uncharacterized protein LOC125043127 [Penaeus chinensis]|uniref:uncharacterized protein LOC125043127 n=1 Tax=Penaeus chinensis TaxID=139456 RepID=UPI001FB8215C|nr:uncharacterized protein LOC125043127 [Penaeus chinensis]